MLRSGRLRLAGCIFEIGGKDACKPLRGFGVKDQAPDALDDEDLLERLRKHDESAFRELIRRSKAEIAWIVTRMVGYEHTEDMVQEVFLRVYETIGNFRGESSLRTWLNRIAYNLCVSFLRKQARHGSVSLDEVGEEALFHLLPASDSSSLKQLDLSLLLEDAIGELPPRYRAVITFYYDDRLKYHEIAEIMDMPIGTVKTYLHRARLRLRHHLVRSGYKPGKPNRGIDREV